MNRRVFPFREGDIPEILRLADECELSPWSAAALREEIGRSDSINLSVLVAGVLSGFILGRVIPSHSVEDGFDAEIFNIGVGSAFRRTGIGDSLIDHFIRECLNRSVHSIWLEVRSANTGAIQFYKKHEFIQLYKRKSFYSSPPDDALVLKRELSVLQATRF